MIARVQQLYDKVVFGAEKIPYGLTAVLLRLGLFGIFWTSAMTKLVFGATPPDSILAQIPAVLSFDWNIGQNTFFLFEYEYQVPLLPPHIAAYMATASELVFSVLILMGLFTRLSAFALLGMTLVIQLFVYPELWLTHALWAGTLVLLVSRGGGSIALDRGLRKFFS